MINDVARNLDAMNPAQYVLAFAFVGSYALALGEFIGTRGRWIAVLAAIASSAGFAALTDPWEQGVVLVAIALAGMGLFVGVSWVLWSVTSRLNALPARSHRRHARPMA